MEVSPIFIIGGTGDVGIALARNLTEFGNWPIVLCSRNPDKVSDIANEIGATTLAIDASDKSSAGLILKHAILVNLTEATTPEFIAECLARGVRVIDSSASQSYLLALEAVVTTSASGALVPQSGLMPGLSNLIAFALVKARPQIVSLDIVIEMGMGRHHGLQATIWTLKSLGEAYPVYARGEVRQLKPGALRKLVNFSGDKKPRLALSFPFSDQTVITRDPKLSGAVSYLSLAPAIITRLFGGMLRLGLGPFVARHAEFFSRTFAAFPAVGTTGTRMVIEGFDANGKFVAKSGLSSVDQAQLTALVLTLTIEAIAASEQRGIVPITSLLSANDILSAILSNFSETTIETV